MPFDTGGGGPPPAVNAGTQVPMKPQQPQGGQGRNQAQGDQGPLGFINHLLGNVGQLVGQYANAGQGQKLPGLDWSGEKPNSSPWNLPILKQFDQQWQQALMGQNQGQGPNWLQAMAPLGQFFNAQFNPDNYIGSAMAPQQRQAMGLQGTALGEQGGR